MAKGGLGRGLGALLPDTDMIPGIQEAGSGQGTPISVALGKIQPNPHQPRKDFNEESLEELAASVREHGIIQPILVEETADGAYRIVAGERRWRAAQKAGLREVPVLVKEFTEEQRIEVALIENIQRSDLNPVEEALGYRSIMDVTGQPQEEVARRVGKNRSTVANALRLLRLPDEMLKALRSGELTPGHARAILAVTSPSEQVQLFARITKEGFSVRQAEEEARALNGKKPDTGGLLNAAKGKAGEEDYRPQPRDPDLVALEQRMIDALGTKVSLQGDGKKGKLVIEYYSMDDLERMLRVIVGPNL